MAWLVECADKDYEAIKRAVIFSRPKESQASIMRRAKAAVGLSGVQGKTTLIYVDSDPVERLYRFVPRKRGYLMQVLWEEDCPLLAKTASGWLWEGSTG